MSNFRVYGELFADSLFIYYLIHVYVFRYISCIHLVVDRQFYIVIVSMFVIVSVYLYIDDSSLFAVWYLFVLKSQNIFNLLTYDQNWPIIMLSQTLMFLGITREHQRWTNFLATRHQPAPKGEATLSMSPLNGAKKKFWGSMWIISWLISQPTPTKGTPQK